MAANAPTPERLLVTVSEACSMLSIGRSHIYKLHRHGVFDFVKLGGSTRIRIADVERLAGVEATL
ncbi:MAG: excisionase family DNA binding protein [Myxococcota bacterium]|jgi:excisionase family DNA binding protein